MLSLTQTFFCSTSCLRPPSPRILLLSITKKHFGLFFIPPLKPFQLLSVQILLHGFDQIQMEYKWQFPLLLHHSGVSKLSFGYSGVHSGSTCCSDILVIDISLLLNGGCNIVYTGFLYCSAIAHNMTHTHCNMFLKINMGLPSLIPGFFLIIGSGA